MEATRKKILIVEDDEYVLGSVHMLLSKDGYAVSTATNGELALSTCQKEQFDLAIIDLKMPGMDGIQVLKGLKKLSPDTMVIMMTAFGSIQNAVEAMRSGASDYITKPISAEEIKLAVQKVLEKQKLIREIKALRQELEQRYSLNRIIGKSPKMQEVYDLILTVSQADATVLITGETGTGKELVARTIHMHSNRKGKPFVAVNCSALPESLLESELFGYEKGAFTGATSRRVGKFEFANSGTIFFDETSNMSHSIQSKLLRVLQERELERVGGNEVIKVDVRVVAATNKDLKKELAEGRFREDLFYRLNVFPITLPPLRERKEDIPLLATSFLEKYSKAMKKEIREISQDVLNTMMEYHWPGNVRELENLMERAVIMARGDTITYVDLPRTGLETTPTKEVHIDFSDNKMMELPLEEFLDGCEKTYIEKLLEKNKGKIDQSAGEAAVDPKTLYRKMKKYLLTKKAFKATPEQG
ncbi:MAG: sigma-54 dependent transcriptional regulator [Planctomycetota bacterium]